MVDSQTLQRAVNYFAIWELLGHNPERTAEVWWKAKSLFDVNQLLEAQALQSLGYLDVDAELLPVAQKRVAEAMKRHLAENDFIFEKCTQAWPSILEDLAADPDIPEFLFVRGHPELLDRTALAVVGTRHPSEEGRRRARKLGLLLARRNIVVTSGLALGIDESAHMGALEAGGATVAVLGTPLHITYPKQHLELQRLIGEAGALVSQFYPGAKVHPMNFPMRDAVMSALCRGTVVVEAGETSGALIQARKALAQGRKLFIPQSALDNPNITWPARFLRRGAIKFGTIDEVLAAIDSFLPTDRGESRQEASRCSLRLISLTL